MAGADSPHSRKCPFPQILQEVLNFRQQLSSYYHGGSGCGIEYPPVWGGEQRR